MAAHVITPHHRRDHQRRGPLVRLTVIAVLAAAALAVFAIRGCRTTPVAPPGRETVTIAGSHFFLEPAVTEPARILGLGQRDHIEPNGGMLFIFPTADYRQFIMRDCPMPIDIAYLDDAGRIVRMHEMTPEPPRAPNESAMDYELRLRRYASDYRVRYVVEVAGGTWRRLGVKPGDPVVFEMERLKALTR